MRILYIDIDSLRPDHIGCYGYHRAITPNIDRIAAQGVRFGNCYATDVPCLPSRTAIYQCRHGIHTGVIDHGGTAADPFVQGPDRGFRSRLVSDSMPMRLRGAGYYTAQISPFGERHAALQFFAGFNEIHNPVGGGGMESAEQVAPCIEEWLDRKGADDDWYLHVNLWDPHTPYRAPDEVVESLAEMPLPEWYTEEVRQRHWAGCGPHSAREVMGYSDQVPAYLKGRPLPRQPWSIDSMDAAKRMFDGYDTGVRYADEHVGRVLQALEETGALDNTAIIISADHGENLGELNVYGDHQTADHITCRVPLIIRWPGVTDSQAGRIDDALHYHLDFAATAVELASGRIEDGDGLSFAPALRNGQAEGRDALVVSQGAWCVQRGVRFGPYYYIRTWHDAWHDFPEEMLFDIENDPHELNDLAAEKPEILQEARNQLAAWKEEQLRRATHAQDPLDTVLAEGGSLHARDKGDYLERLRQTGRAHLADRLAAKNAKLPQTADV